MEVPTLKPLSEDQARFYFQDLIKGIEYCKPCPGGGGTGLGWGRGAALSFGIVGATASGSDWKVPHFPAGAKQEDGDTGQCGLQMGLSLGSRRPSLHYRGE